MFLLFHDIGMPPLWMLVLWLAAFLSFPIFFIKGLYSLAREKSNSTFAYTFLALFLIALAYQILWVFIYREISFFVFMTFPFGVGAMPLFALLGLPHIFINLLGLVINFISIYGAAGIIEKAAAKFFTPSSGIKRLR
ncbi:MAG TPA: hypothetical protein VGB00_03580 [Pyrinomonadaceae bacterium]|jgi:hypothetical protein